ncbi:MAG: MMPL family transporter [Thermodesulfobacteriota bacterium]|nr:MMPL family transporter [Thermodesulfobacteriota bacterium]
MNDKTAGFWEKLVYLQIRFRVPILIVILIVTVFFGYKIYERLEVKTDFFELYPPRHEYIKIYKEFRKMLGTANVMQIIIENKRGDIYNTDTITKIDKLTKGIMELKGVNSLQITSLTHPTTKNIEIISKGVSILPFMYYGIPQTPEACEKLKKMVYSNEGIRGFHVGIDDRSASITAAFWEEGVDLNVMHKQVMKLVQSIEDENHKCYICGYPMLYAWIAHYRGETFVILTITFIAMVLLVLGYFRSGMGIFIPAVSCLLSAIWGLGFAGAMGYNLDPLLLVVPVLLSARALCHSIQCLDRYYEEFTMQGDKEKAIVTAYSALYIPAILGIVTDGLGVLTIAVATIPLIQKLAFFASFWIISIFVSVTILNPIILSYVRAPKSSTEVSQKDQVEKKGIARIVADGIYGVSFRGLNTLAGPRAKWGVLVVSIIILVGGGYWTTATLTIGDSSAGGAILYPDHPYNIASKKANTDYVGESQLVIIVQGNEYEAIKKRKSLEVMEKLGVFMKRNIENVGGTFSMADVVRRVFRMYHEGDPRWEMIPDRDATLGQVMYLFLVRMSPPEQKRYVTLPDYKTTHVTAFLRNYTPSVIKNAIAKCKEFAKEIEKDKDSLVKLKVAAGILGIMAAVNEEVEWSYWATLIVVFVATFLLCLLGYRSIKCALILIIPLLISQILCQIFMLMQNIGLNINTLPVAAIGAGIGIDYGIYLLSRLKEECATAASFEEASYISLTTAGKPIMFTALTLTLGVIFFLFATMKFQSLMGLLIMFLMIANMIIAFVVIPALTAIFKPAFVKEIGREVKD